MSEQKKGKVGSVIDYYVYKCFEELPDQIKNNEMSETDMEQLDKCVYEKVSLFQLTKLFEQELIQKDDNKSSENSSDNESDNESNEESDNQSDKESDEESDE